MTKLARSIRCEQKLRNLADNAIDITVIIGIKANTIIYQCILLPLKEPETTPSSMT